MRIRITNKATQERLLTLAKDLDCTLDKAIEHLVITLKGEQPNDNKDNKAES
jgi:hypothetical protein